MPRMTHYAFKIEYLDSDGSLSHYVSPLNPQDDEYFQILFDTPEAAFAFLKEHNLEKIAKRYNWILMEVVYTPWVGK